MAKNQPQTVKQELLNAFNAAVKSGDIDAMREVNYQMKLLYEQTGEMSAFLMYAETKVSYSAVESIEAFEEFIKENNYYHVRVSEPQNVAFFSHYAFHVQRFYDVLPVEMQKELPDPLQIVDLIIKSGKEHYAHIGYLAFVLFENRRDEQLLQLLNKHKFKAKEAYLFFKMSLAAVSGDLEKLDAYFFRLARFFNLAILTRPNKRNIIGAINRIMSRYNTNIDSDISSSSSLSMNGVNRTKMFSENQSRHYDVCDILTSFLIGKLTAAGNESMQAPQPDFDEALSEMLNERAELFRELAK